MAEMTEDARLAIYGYNEATNKAYTPEESAAASGGYNAYAGFTETKFDPIKGELTAINPNTGQSMTLGAKFRTSATGNIIPAESSRPPGVGYDDSGKPYGPGQVIPNESLEAYVQRMAQIGPGALSYKGKFYQYNARGMFYENGTQEPVDFVDTEENASNTGYIQRFNPNLANNKNLVNSTKDSSLLSGNAALLKEIADLKAASKFAYDTAAQDRTDAITEKRVSAFQTLKEEFEKYGLGSLVESVRALVLNGTPKSEAVLKLRATPQYQLRFAGNKIRLAEGKNLYDESTYLALENDFQSSFEAYGQKALLGSTRESAQAMFSEYIGSDKSPTEIKDRIRLAVDEVSNRKDIRAEFQKYFPEITDSDLVSYFLKPKETLSTLNSKVRVAQIGSAASAQGLNANLTTATDLEQLGLTEQQARTGYQRVATDLPGIEKLGAIDNMNIGQTTAENAYLKGLASEQRKIDQAAQRERNRFAQSSGMNKVSLTDAKPAGQY